MKNFKIDQLTITKTGTSIFGTPTYQLDGVCNINSQGDQLPNSIKLSENKADKALEINVTGLTDTDKLIFSFKNIKFGHLYGSQDYLSIVFVDTTNGTVANIKAGFAIKDNNYPPPYQRDGLLSLLPTHDEFSDKFNVEKIVFTRSQINPANFTTEITLKFDSTQEDYLADSLNVVQDTLRKNLVAVIQLKKNTTQNPSGGTIYVSLIDDPTLEIIPLPGLCFIIKTDDYDWPVINTKKILAFIY